jgi:hypothetical protein
MSIDFNRVETLPERLAWFDEHHRLIVEGKPFFLLGMYGCGKNDAEADIYADSAFNCTLTGSPAALDLAAARGLKVLYNVHRLANADEADVERECKKMAGRKEVIVWYTNDELPPGLVPQQTQLYNRLRKYDPNRPVFAVLDKYYHVRDFMPSFDVIAMDPYPVGNRRREPWRCVQNGPGKRRMLYLDSVRYGKCRSLLTGNGTAETSTHPHLNITFLRGKSSVRWPGNRLLLG